MLERRAIAARFQQHAPIAAETVQSVHMTHRHTHARMHAHTHLYNRPSRRPKLLAVCGSSGAAFTAASTP